MANRYWVGGNGTWDNTTTTNWSTSINGGGGASVPTSADDVYFTSSSNASSYQVTIPSTSVQNCRSISIAAPASGSVTFVQSGNPTINVYGSWTNAATGITWSINSALITFKSTSTGNTITTNGLSMQSNWTFDGVGGSWILQDNFTVGTTGRIITLTNGTLDLNGKTITNNLFSSNNSNVRTLAFGTTGKLVSNGSNNRIFDFRTQTNFTATGNKVIECTYSGGTGTRTISGASSLDVKVTAGTDIVVAETAFNNLDFTGFAGTIGGGSRLISGNLTIPAGVTVSASALTTTFVGSGTQLVTTSGVTLDFPVTIDTATGTVQLVDTLTLGATRRLLLTRGSFNMNGQNCSVGVFSSGNANTRTLATGVGTLSIAGNNDFVWGINNTAGLVVTGDRKVNFTYAGATGTRYIRHGNNPTTYDAATAVNMSFTAGTDTVSFSASVQNLDTTGFAGPFWQTTLVAYGNVTFGATTTVSSSTAVMTLAGTSGTQTVTTNGKTLEFPITVSATNDAVVFADALTQSATRLFTFTSGTLKFKEGVTHTFGAFKTTGTTQKFLQSALPGAQTTLSQPSGTVSTTYTTIQDTNVTGGAVWQAFTTNQNIDAGNNTGWDFIQQIGRYIYTRRKNKRILL